MANKVQVPTNLALDTGQTTKLPVNKLTENGSGDHQKMVSPTGTPSGGEVNHTNSQQIGDGATKNGTKGMLNGPVCNNVHRQNHVNKMPHNGEQVDNNNGSVTLLADVIEPSCVIEQQSQVATSPPSHNGANNSQSDQTDSQLDTTLMPSADSVDGLDELDMGARGPNPPDVRVQSPSPPKEVPRRSPRRHPSCTHSLPSKNYLSPADRGSRRAKRNLTVTGVTDEARIVLEQFLQRSLSHVDKSPLRHSYQHYADYKVTDTVDENVQTHTGSIAQINDTLVVRDNNDISPHVQRSTSYREASGDSILSDNDQVDGGADNTSYDPNSMSNSIHSTSSSSFKHRIHVRPTTEQAVYDALAKLKNVEDTVDKKKKSKKKKVPTATLR